MADDTPTDTKPIAPLHFEHYCQHPGCKTWGYFGYDNRVAKTTDWFCMEHRPDKK